MNQNGQSGGAEQADTQPLDPLITISFNGLMNLAKRLIGEQIDNCDEEFMAGRAHGIGSLHSEILGLAKESIARQVHSNVAAGMDQPQDETAAAGTVGIATLKAAVKDIAARLNSEIVDQYAEPQEEGDADGWRNYYTGKLSGLFDLERSLFAWLDTQNAQVAQEQRESAGAAQTCRSSEKVQVMQEQSAAALAPRSTQSEARDALPSDQAQEVGAALAEEVLSTLLWLYRRLPRGYGRPPTVERPILALARQTGVDVSACLAERGPDPLASNENN